MSSLPPNKPVEAERVTQYLPSPYPESMDVSLALGDQLWIGYESTLYYSPDGGVEWEIKPLPDSDAYAVGIGSIDSGQTITVISQTGQRYISQDAGETWQSTDFRPLLETLIDEPSIDSELQVERAYISDDGSHMVLLFECEIAASKDAGLSWEKPIQNSSLPKPGQYFYCADDVMLDENFDPEFVKMHMTGSIRSGDYVLANQSGQWVELCTPDPVLAILGVAVDCEEQENKQLVSRFTDSNALLKWLLLEDRLDAIYQAHHQPLPAGLLFDHSFEILPGADNKYWFFSHLGIAITNDDGQTWRTLIGGGGELSDIIQMGASRYLGINRGKIYQSTDAKVWEALHQSEEIWQLKSTSRGALALGDHVLLYETTGHEPSTVLTASIDDLMTFNHLTWATSNELIAVSNDGGLVWQQHIDAADTIWSCFQTCLGVDDYGKLKQALLIDDVLSVQAVNQFNENEFYSAQGLWGSNLEQTWLIGTYTEDNEFPSYWLTTDYGKSLSKIALNKDQILEVFYHDDGTASIISEQGLHSLDLNTATIESILLPSEVTVSEACRSSTGLIMGEAYTDEYSLVFYQSADSKNWYTDREEQLWCET